MIYLDNAATSGTKAPGVASAMVEALSLGNPGRGAHDAALASGRVLHRVRVAAGALLGTTPERVVLTHSATAGLNLVIGGTLEPGDHAVTTDLDHNAVLRPLYRLRDRGVGLTVVRSHHGVVTPDAVVAALRPSTRLVVLTHASNVLGTVQPVADIAEACRQRGVAVVVDAAQSAGALPIDVDGWGLAALACGGHKALLGPAGTGLLAFGQGVQPRPLEVGGTGFDSRSQGMPTALPEALEAGTPNVPGLAGLGAALVSGRPNPDATLEVARRLREGLRGTGRWAEPTIDEAAWGVPVVAGNLRDAAGAALDPAEVADGLAERGVAVRAGFHCAPLVHEHYRAGDAAGMVRFSPGHETTDSDVDAAVAAVADLLAELR